jgi:integrase
MNPRPRGKKANGLPPNLYMRSGGRSFIYRRPDDGTWHGMGTDRLQAIQAAKQLNSLLMEGTDLVRTVLGSAQTLNDFLDYYENEVLPPRELASATLSQFRVRKRQIAVALGERAIDSITLKDISDFLDKMTPRSSNQTRQHLADIFAHAAAKGLVPENIVALTIPRIDKKKRKRHTVEGLQKIREHSPQWLRNAIDLCLITAQRREDIVAMRFDDVKDDGLYVAQIKTKKHSDAGWIKFRLTPQLVALISRCRDNVVSPFLIHRHPERIDAKQRASKEHWTAVEPGYLSHAFKQARDAANAYPGMSPEEQPGFHQVRALALYLYKKAGKKPEQRKQIAGHASEGMTKNYESDHEEIVWTNVVADLDIESIFK